MMYYFTHFASNLLLIGMIPLHDGTDGKVPQRSSWGYGEGIYSGAVKWKYFNGRTTGSALMHLAFKSEQEGVLRQWITQTHPNRDFWEAGPGI